MHIEKQIDTIIDNFIQLKKSVSTIEEIARKCKETITSGGKIMFCGNGGSASDSQHLAAELVVKYKKERSGIPAIALTTDTSILTAIANDMGAEKIFERQVEALGRQGDLLIGITTSGNSLNVINAFKKARGIGITTVAFTGMDGGKIKEFSDIIFNVPSNITNNIQEMHIAVGHIICDLIES